MSETITVKIGDFEIDIMPIRGIPKDEAALIGPGIVERRIDIYPNGRKEYHEKWHLERGVFIKNIGTEEGG